jgi:hypothetical protein
MPNKFTPGPWVIAPDPKHLAAAPVVISSTRNIAKVLYHLGSEDNEVNANAHLIAAAPELLEVCEKLLAHACGDTVRGDFLAEAELAIAKAKGEEWAIK